MNGTDLAETPAHGRAAPGAARRRRGLIAFVPLVLVSGLGALFWSNMDKDPSELPSALVGKPAPTFDLPPLPGHGDGLSDALLRTGRPTLVNVFASWCVPCRIEHPMLMRLKEAGQTIYGINYKDQPAKAATLLDELGDPYTEVGVDRDGRVAIDFGVYGVPETFVIDGAGKILLRFPGPLTPEILHDRILPALDAAAG